MKEKQLQFVGTGQTNNRKVVQPKNEQKICYWCRRKESKIAGYCKPCHRLFNKSDKIQEVSSE